MAEASGPLLLEGRDGTQIGMALKFAKELQERHFQASPAQESDVFTVFHADTPDR
jgi:hypothetical protein